jgi:hypothetical protein
MKQNLIIIKYPIDNEYLDVETLNNFAKDCRKNHPDHEFIFLPKELDYEVIKNECYEQSYGTLSRCSEEIPEEPNSGLLSSREPELRTGDTLFGCGYETDSGSIF